MDWSRLGIDEKYIMMIYILTLVVIRVVSDPSFPQFMEYLYVILGFHLNVLSCLNVK
ncbi:hypothetical protein BDA99DRAFT_165798 [Phascolomyces articulosus]|uniref:Uncharacterized protein n=1 Tax=Phascolomyces articulosus TaxID=60185 RepID=A0AAD5PB28_9FUNG|nr:hypothetical protein BDA99DRAFT_165798 [Phascolomyces articulosus]